MIEFSVVVAALSAFVTIAMFVAYYSFGKVWIKHSLYEALICQMQEVTRNVCEQELRSKIKWLLPIGNITEIRLNHRFDRAQGRVEFKITNKHRLIEGVTLKRTDL